MNPRVSFLVIDRGQSPIEAIQDALARQTLPSEAIDLHVVTAGPDDAATLPDLTGDVVVFLDEHLLPAEDLARVALETVEDAPDPDRSLLVGRVLPDPERITDPISRQLATGRWNHFTRITDPDHLALHQFHARCLCLSRGLYEGLRDAFASFLNADHPSDLRLGRQLLDDPSVRLRFRPRITAYLTRPLPLVEAADGACREGHHAVAIAERDPELRPALDLPDPTTLRHQDLESLERRLSRLVTVGEELTGLDILRIAVHEPTDVPVADPIGSVTESVLKATLDTARRIGWVEGTRESEAARESLPETEIAEVDLPEIEMAEVEIAESGTPEPEIIESEITEPVAETVAEEPIAIEPVSEEPVAAEPVIEIPEPEISGPEPIATGPDPIEETAPTGTDEKPLVSIIVVATDAVDVLPSCLEALAGHTPEDHEILVVDNGSTDGTAMLARTARNVDTVLPISGRIGYAQAVNLTLPLARGTHIVLLEPEALPGPGWLTPLIEAVTDDVGMVAPVSSGLMGTQNVTRHLHDSTVLSNLDRLVQALRQPDGPRAAPTQYIQPLCALIPRDRLERFGPLDARLQLSQGALLALAWHLRRARQRLVVAIPSFVARSGGLRPSAADDGQFIEEMRTLRAIVAAQSSAPLPRSRELWGVDWTGFDEPTSHQTPRLSVVIPVHDQLPYTRLCLESLRASSVDEVEIVIFDNGSTDGTAEYLESQEDVKVLSADHNLGFAPAVNQGLEATSGRFVLVLNNDVILPERTLERMLTVMESRPDLGMVGPVCNESAPSQKIEAGYSDLRELDRFADSRWMDLGTTVREVDVVLGLAMLMRREVIDTVGLFDERFEIGNFEDADYSLRAGIAGFGLGVVDGVYLHHFGSRTFAGAGLDYDALLLGNRERFLEKWGQSSVGEISLDATAVTPPVEIPIAPIEPAAPIAKEASAEDEIDPSLVRTDGIDVPGWIPMDANEDDVTGDEQPTVAIEPAIPGDEEMIDPDDSRLTPGALYLVGNDHLEQGRFEEALDHFQWATEKNPDLVMAHMGIGLSLVRLGRLEEAIPALEKTVSLAPDFSEGHNNLGVLYHLLGRRRDAQRALERAVAFDPGNEEARTNLDEIRSRTRASV